ncbi:MAG: D-glycero-beta-D-manno-heptose-7-phosphate kinase [Desulfobacteraceae bacterium]|nr:D-glycero-beta-D-manno-heptose-7-phosphate kinase [Desulfobacteraceae bacterium]
MEFEKCSVLVVGDLMLDEYLWGDVDRISPEAPVQIVSVRKEEYTPGGAGNVVNNLVALGANVLAVGVIGDAENGNRLLEKLKGVGVDTSGIIREKGRLTTLKTRIIAAGQHVLRIDRETKRDISGRTFEILTEFVDKKIPEVDAVLISDYGKGLLTNTLLSKLVASARKHEKRIIADPKGLDFSKYSGVSLLTPNKKEASLASDIEITDESTLFRSGEKILKIANLERLLITCGKDGMVLFEQNREPYRIQAVAHQVYDVSGAGDTVVSVLGLASASGLSFKQGAELANTAAGIVVGKVGTATVSKEELDSALKEYPDEISLKHKSLSELADMVRELKKKGRQIVVTNGCFDLLHAGHIMLFSASKQMGDVLIAAINDDDSVKELKGHGRPVIGQKERIRILCALDSVDYVTLFSSSDELETIIKTIQPDILTKGSNYTHEEVFGHELVEACGGKIALVPVTENISSTEIINNIRKGKRLRVKG